jgi:uncharacterized membrane protein YccC
MNNVLRSVHLDVRNLMPDISEKAKEAIKTALAMTIVYGIALYMEWDRPYWAGFAVAFISMATIQQSLSKGFMRMLGTLAAGIAALTLIALFPQQRWWFMGALSIYVGICTYMMTGKNIPYFYQVSAFVCVIICFDGGVNSLNAFETAIVRIQETGMGISAYVLISVFLWPRRDNNDSTDKNDQKASKTPNELSHGIFSLEPKRIKAALEVIINLWLAFLIWVYVDPPGHASFVIIVTTISLGLARFPAAKAASMIIPAIGSCIFSGVLYIFVMPLLSGFIQLGAMIFPATFAIAYLFSKPQQTILRAFGLAFFATLTSISNQQSYSFSSYANSSLMIILAIFMLLITQNLLFKPQLAKERFCL